MASHDDEGASPRELVLEACRRNNTDLLQSILSSPTTSTSHADLLNTARDSLGNTALHIAARSGSYEILDLLLDQDGLECDPLDRMNGGTPLHSAVEYANTFGSAPSRPGSGTAIAGMNGGGGGGEGEEQNPGNAIVEILVDAGCDPRIRNKGKMKAVDLVDPRNEALRSFLRKAEVMAEMEAQAVRDAGDVADEDEGGSGPESGNEL